MKIERHSDNRSNCDAPSQASLNSLNGLNDTTTAQLHTGGKLGLWHGVGFIAATLAARDTVTPTNDIANTGKTTASRAGVCALRAREGFNIERNAR